MSFNVNNMPFYSKYLFNADEVSEHSSNLAYNLAVHTRGEEYRASTKKVTEKAVVVGTQQAKTQVLKGVISLAAGYCLAPLGFDPYMVKQAVNHVVMPELKPVIAKNKIEEARKVYGVGSSILSYCGLDNVIASNFYAFGAVDAEEPKLAKQIHFVANNLENRVSAHFDVNPYRSINPLKVGFSALRNLVHTIYVVACKIICVFRYGINNEEIVQQIYQDILHESNINVDLAKVSSDMSHPHLLTEKYDHSAINIIKTARNAKKIINNTFDSLISWVM